MMALADAAGYITRRRRIRAIELLAAITDTAYAIIGCIEYAGLLRELTPRHRSPPAA